MGGIVANRKQSGNMLTGVDHLQATYNRAEQAFTKGEPEWDVVSNPELVATTHAFAAAGEWWSRNKANAVADEGDTVRAVQKVSRLVNRGNANSTRAANGEDERVDLFRKVAKAMREAGVWS